MIYDCPQCGTPQVAGATACPHCHARFDGPVPGDAIIPEGTVFPEAASSETVSADALASAVEETAGMRDTGASVYPQSAVPAAAALITEAAPATEVKPPPPADQPYLTPPSYNPAPYSPPPYSPPAYAPPVRSSSGSLTRVLLIAFPIVLVLVLGGVYYTSSLNSGADTSPAPPPVVPVAQTTLPPPPVGAPVTLPGGSNAEAPQNDPHARPLLGHWQAKNGEEYTFSGDGSGVHIGPDKQEQAFTWGVVQNRVMLYMAQDQALRFNAGPDDDTLFLGAQAGRYVQYARVKSAT